MPHHVDGFKHALPSARVVDRIRFLIDLVRDKRVAHVGFADLGCRELQEARETWLHRHLASSASSIVGIDTDVNGVHRARQEGYEAYVADCRQADELRNLRLAPFDIIVAGEVIEHIDEPGRFLNELHALGDNAQLCITTPNAYSAVNMLAVFAGTEVIHPDHIALYSWRTLTELLRRHGWYTTESLTYVSPPARNKPHARLTGRLQTAALNGAIQAQGRLAKFRWPFAADGLIVLSKAQRR